MPDKQDTLPKPVQFTRKCDWCGVETNDPKDITSCGDWWTVCPKCAAINEGKGK